MLESTYTSEPSPNINKIMCCQLELLFIYPPDTASLLISASFPLSYPTPLSSLPNTLTPISPDLHPAAHTPFVTTPPSLLPVNKHLLPIDKDF